MISLISLIISLIAIFTPCVVCDTATTSYTHSNSITAISTTNEIVDGFNTINLNNHKHYLGLDDASNFAITSTHLYYSTDTTIYSYSFESETSTKIIDVSGVDKLSYANNTLYVFKDNTLYKLNGSTLESYQICDMYSIYSSSGNTYLSIISGNNFKTISINSLSEVVLWDTTIPTSFTPVCIANSNTTAYVVAKQNNTTKILEMNFQQKVTSDPYSYGFSIDEIYYWSHNGTSPILACYTNDYLSTIYKLESTATKYSSQYDKRLNDHGDYAFEENTFYTIKDCYIYGEHLYILDNIYSAIQKFEYSTDIKFVETITSSSAYADGKFYNPHSFGVVDKNIKVVADTFNRAIQVIDGFESTMVKNYTDNSTKVNFNYVTRVIKTNTNYYVLEHDSLDNYQILVLDTNFNLVQNISHNLLNILDIELISNDLYILDGNTSTLYRYTNSIIESTTINSLTLDANSKLHYIIETNTLSITSGTNVYFVDMSSKNITTYNHNEEVHGVTSDYIGNAYVLSDSKITRTPSLEPNTGSKQANITTNSIYSHISIEKDTGYIYLFNIKNQCFEVLKSSKVYTLDNEYTHPVDITTYTSTTPVDIAITKDNVYAYTYPYNTGLSYDISNQNVYILGEANGYYYICYRHYNDNNYSDLGLGYISKDSVTIKNYNTLGLSENFEVLSDTTIYTLPTMLQYNGSNLEIGELTKGSYIKSNYELLTGTTYTIDGCDYYIISTESGIGYIKKVDVVSIKANHTEEILKPNAKLVVSEDKYNGVYIYAGNSSIVIDKLIVGHEIYVDNYDINAKYTYIRYLDENNREHGGYVLTKCIKMNDNGDTNIGAIILIVLAVVAVAGITTFYIISYRKQQKEITNSTKTDYE